MPIANSLTAKRRLIGGIAAFAAVPVILSGCTVSGATQEQLSNTYAAAGTLTLDLNDAGAKQFGITTSSLSATVTGADRNDVKIQRTFEFTDGDKPEENIRTEASGLVISASCPERLAVGRPTCVAKYEITVPFGTVINAGTKFGDLTVSDTRGAIDLTSRYGDVTATVDGGAYAVEAVSTTGTSTVEVPHDPAGIPVTLRTDDGAAKVTTARH